MLSKLKSVSRVISKYTIYKIFSFNKINEKKIVIVNFEGKGYGDNSKYIVNEILRQNKNYEIIWLVKKEILEVASNFPQSVKLVDYQSLDAHKHLATAKVWFDNCRKPWYVKKRRNQFYIQLWHGSPSLKKIEADAVQSLSKMYIYNAKKDSQKVDVFISNCDWFTQKVSSTFWYNGEIRETGLPRNDILFCDESHKLEIKKRISTEDKVNFILYAPTFRKDLEIKAYDLNFDGIIKFMENKTGQKWAFLVRLHPNIANKSREMHFSRNVIDVSNYPDLQELIIASDILITDYSSIMFDFSITKKPVFLYCNDIEEYKNDRNFYFDITQLPFPLAISKEDLQNKMVSFNNEIYQVDLINFFDEVGMKEDGNSSKRVVEIMEYYINNR